MKIKFIESGKRSSGVFHKSKLHLAVLIAFSAVVPAYAQLNHIYEWNGNSSTGFTDIGNWSSVQIGGSGGQVEAVINQIVPGETPKWLIDTAYSYPEIAPGKSPNMLTVGSGAGSQGELIFTRTDQDPADPDNVPKAGYWQQVHVGVNGGSGTFVIDSNDSSYPVFNETSGSVLNLGMMSVSGAPDVFAVGVGAGSEGRISLLGSGKSTQQQGNYSDGATLNVTTNAGIPTLGDDTKIGADGGRGVIDVDGGSISLQTSNNSLVLGSGAGAYGEVNVLAGGKFAHNVFYAAQPGASGDALILGKNGGHGVLNISGISTTRDIYSRAVVGSGITLGNGAGSRGELHISEGAQLQSGLSSYTDGLGAPAYTAHKVGVDGGEGYVTINGENSIWKVLGVTNSMANGGVTGIGELYLGHSGVGEMTLSNGGTLSIGESDYGSIPIYDPDDPSSQIGNYNGEISHTGGLGTLHLASGTGSKATLNIGAAAGSSAQSVGHLDVKDVQFGEGNASIVFNHTDNTGNYTFDTTLISGNGDGLIRQLAGTTILADQAQYTGDLGVEGGKLLINGTQAFDKTNISGGLLRVNGQYSANQTIVSGGYFDLPGVATGAMEVKGSGFLTGDGLAGDVTVNAGGTIAPGAGLGQMAGELTVDSVKFNTGSTYQVHLNPGQASDLLYATSADGGSGTAVINGGNVNIVTSFTAWQQDVRYIILKADAGVTGRFDQLTGNLSSNMAFLDPTLGYDANTAYLYMARNNVSFGDVGLTFNQKNTGNGIQSLGNGTPVYNAIVGMQANEARNAYDNLSGEIHASAYSALLSNSRYVRAGVNDHLMTRFSEPGNTLWAHTWVHSGHVQDDGNADRTQNKGNGFLIGADVPVINDESVIGLAGGYERTEAKSKGLRQSNAGVDAYHVMLYGKTKIDQINLRAGIGYAWFKFDTERNIWVDTLQGKNSASYDGGQVQTFVEASRPFNLNENASLTPYLNLSYVQIKTDGFSESGTSAALSSSNQKNDIGTATIGARGKMQMGAYKQHYVYVDLGMQNRFGDKTPETALRFAGGQDFQIRGSSLGTTSALARLGGEFELKRNIKLNVSYEGDFGSRVTDHAAKVTLEWKF